MECVYKKTGFILYKLIPCLLVTMYAFMCLYGSSVYASNDNDFLLLLLLVVKIFFYLTNMIIMNIFIYLVRIIIFTP